VEGIAREPVAVLEFEAFKEAPMTVDSKGNVVYNGKPLKTKTNIVATDHTIKEGSKIS
jgi:hypothetical protein